jgi:predicted phosphodiesterase
MKIAAISDIHGNLPALEAVLEDIARLGADVTVNLGDILSGPLQVAQTADLLMSKDFPTIAGNHERQLLKLRGKTPDKIDPLTSDGYAATQINEQHAAWLRAQPPELWLAPDILMVHGTPTSDLVYFLETTMPDVRINGSPGIRAATAQEVKERLGSVTAPLVLCGHSHVPRAVQCGATLVVNPGSVGLQAYSDDHVHAHVTENGSPHARYALLERTRQGWQVEQRAVPYDWAPVARLAQENGRPDWAFALATGCMPPETFSRRNAS